MDDELNAIRQARLAELRNKNGGGSSAGSQAGGDAKRQQDQQVQEEEARQSILSQILTNEARERLSRIRIVRMDRAQAVEGYLINMARSGQLRNKISEPELVSLLDQISQQQNKASSTRIVFNRRGDDEDYGVPESSTGYKKQEDSDEDDFFD